MNAEMLGDFRVALVGAPNCGKSTLFNGLTGGRAKVANYPGATVEMRSGRFVTPSGAKIELVDLPGIYGMTPRSTDERVALEAVAGAGSSPPDMILVLVDAANIRTHLHSVLQLRALGLPMIAVLNMMDLAERDGLEIDIAKLEELLGVPVVASRATKKAGREALIARIDEVLNRGLVAPAKTTKLIFATFRRKRAQSPVTRSWPSLCSIAQRASRTASFCIRSPVFSYFSAFFFSCSRRFSPGHNP
ncbi:MAG: FeoB small GTPase domain-containing protein [Parvularculaceae bacterium]